MNGRIAEHYLEARLRAERPIAPKELTAALAAADPAGRARLRQARAGVLFAGVLTLAIAAALSAVGGVSYAANAVSHAAEAARAVVVTRTHVSPLSISAGGDQYRPGYGFGDPNHNHTGPPGLSTGGGGGQTSPPAQTTRAPDGKAKLAAATISADEQAAIYISVLDAKGNQLLLTQKGTKIGGQGVEGPQVKTIHYVMLVPRLLALRVRIPANLVVAGRRYSIRVIAVDAQGNKSTAFIPFTA